MRSPFVWWKRWDVVAKDNRSLGGEPFNTKVST